MLQNVYDRTDLELGLSDTGKAMCHCEQILSFVCSY